MGNELFRCCVPSRANHHSLEDDAERDSAAACNRVELAASELFSIPGLATAYHTSVLVNGEEFFFSDSGVFNDRTLISHAGAPSERVFLGMSTKTGAHLLRALEPHFKPGTYDLIRKNCNSFSDCAVYYLLRSRLERRFHALERMGQYASMDMIQRVTQGMYRPNTEADSHSSSAVIKSLDALKESELDAQTCPQGPRHKFALSIGALVTIVGLKNAEGLNGQGAEIVRYNGISGRWEARVNISGEVKAFRAENLRPAGEMVFQSGDTAKIQGLRSEVGKSLNGTTCTILRYMHDLSRYEVRLGEDTKALKGINLVLVER